MSNEKYKDIIGFPHHISPTRPRMPQSDRAAQFAPFAALTGYDSMVEETARLTDAEDGYNEENTALIDKKLRILSELEADHPYVEITYFVPDQRKSGGKYETIYGHIKMIDKIEGAIILKDKRRISFDKIRDIDSMAFNELFFE